MTISFYLLLGAVLLLISILTSKLSGRFGVPALALFIGIGIVTGSGGLNLIYLDDYQLAQSLGIIALIYILFSGGLDTRWRKVKPVMWAGVLLSSVGVLVSTAIVGLFAIWLLELGWLEAMLLGAIISSTDAAAVFTILRSKAIGFKYRLRELIEFESGTNDPMAIFLTVGIIQWITLPDFHAGSLILLFLKQMGLGLVGGILFGKALINVLNKINLDYDGLYPVLAITLVPLIYAIVDLLGGSGFLAVYIAGLVLGNSYFIHQRSLIGFFDGLSWLMQITMFLTLGLLVFPEQILAVAPAGLLVAGVLIFIARPISVLASLLFSKLKFRAKMMVSWTGLRGAVPIIMATFPLVAGLENADLLFSLVFFVVVTSVLIQGISIPWVSRVLHVDSPIKKRTKFPIEFEPSVDTKSALKEIEINEGDAAVGKKVVDFKFPDDALIVIINREGKFLVPRGTTQIKAQDKLLVLAKRKMIPLIRKMLKDDLLYLDT